MQRPRITALRIFEDCRESIVARRLDNTVWYGRQRTAVPWCDMRHGEVTGDGTHCRMACRKSPL